MQSFYARHPEKTYIHERFVTESDRKCTNLMVNDWNRDTGKCFAQIPSDSTLDEGINIPSDQQRWKVRTKK